MASEDEGHPPALSAATQPLLAITSVPPHALFPIVKWDFAKGRTATFPQWNRNVRMLLAAFDLTLESLSEEAPIVKAATVVTRQEDEQKALADVELQHQRATRWKRVNTALYWHVEPSAILSGPKAMFYRDIIDGMVRGHLAHGRGLIEFMLSFARMTDVETQMKLSTVIHGSRLREGANITQLLEHIMYVYQHWELLKESDSSQLYPFYEYIVRSLPVKEGTNLHLLRIWLIEEMQRFTTSPTASPSLATYTSALHAIEAKAKALGMPTGDQSHNFVVTLLGAPPDRTHNILLLKEPAGDDSDDAFRCLHYTQGGGRGGGRGGGGRGRGRGGAGRGSGNEKPKLTPEDNDCDFCESWACQSKKHGGASNCACKSTSKFDITKLSVGPRTYIKLARSYHESHPDVTTLKGVRFKRAAKATDAAGGERAPSGSVQMLNGDISTLDQWLSLPDDELGGSFLMLDGTAAETDGTDVIDGNTGRLEEDAGDAAPDSSGVEEPSASTVLALSDDVAASRAALAATEARHSADKLELSSKLAELQAAIADRDAQLAAMRVMSVSDGNSPSLGAGGLTPLPPPLSRTQGQALLPNDGARAAASLESALTPVPSTPLTRVAAKVAKSATSAAATRLASVTEAALTPIPLVGNTPAHAERERSDGALALMARAIVSDSKAKRGPSGTSALTLVGRTMLAKLNLALGTVVHLGLRLDVRDWIVLFTVTRYLAPRLQPYVVAAVHAAGQRVGGAALTSAIALAALVRQRLLQLVANLARCLLAHVELRRSDVGGGHGGGGSGGGGALASYSIDGPVASYTPFVPNELRASATAVCGAAAGSALRAIRAARDLGHGIRRLAAPAYNVAYDAVLTGADCAMRELECAAAGMNAWEVVRDDASAPATELTAASHEAGGEAMPDQSQAEAVKPNHAAMPNLSQTEAAPVLTQAAVSSTLPTEYKWADAPDSEVLYMLTVSTHEPTEPASELAREQDRIESAHYLLAALDDVSRQQLHAPTLNREVLKPLCLKLGYVRTQIGTLRAINAALQQLLLPVEGKLAIKARNTLFGATHGPYWKAYQLLKTLRDNICTVQGLEGTALRTHLASLVPATLTTDQRLVHVSISVEPGSRDVSVGLNVAGSSDPGGPSAGASHNLTMLEADEIEHIAQLRADSDFLASLADWESCGSEEDGIDVDARRAIVDNEPDNVQEFDLGSVFPHLASYCTHGEGYDPSNLECPDHIPGCSCGGAFERTNDYDSDLEMLTAYELNQPTLMMLGHSKSPSMTVSHAVELGLEALRDAMLTPAASAPSLEADTLLMMNAHAADLKISGAASTALPPATMASMSFGKACLNALCDDGASRGASCAKSSAGAITGTYVPDKDGIGVGNSERMATEGSHLCMYVRVAANEQAELIVRRMRITPSLSVDVVLSEASEVYDHLYQFTFDADNGRIMRKGEHVYPLFMSANTKLGWLKLFPVTDLKQQRQYARMLRSANPQANAQLHMLEPLALGSWRTYLNAMEPLPTSSAKKVQWKDELAAPIGDGAERNVGMSHGLKRQLRGVILLRREHARSHASTKVVVANIRASGRGGLITQEDIAAFAREGCGVCDSAKLRRRSFTLRTVADHTPSPPGKKWVSDELTLRVPTAHHGYTKLRIYVDSCTKLWHLVGMHGEKVEDIEQADQKLRVFVRPTHGEIMIIRQDSLPAHRAMSYQSMLLDQNTRSELSPAGVHEGTSLAENAFLHLVPTANAMLLASPDLGEAHFFSAALTALANHNVNAISNSDGSFDLASATKCPHMLYYNTNEWPQQHTHVYSSPCKVLVHPDQRDSKYDLSAKACVYTGPAHMSTSPVHASVWDGDRYFDVDIGCITVDERPIIARTERTHPSHQPFGQDGTRQDDPRPSFSQRYDPHTERHPADSNTDPAELGPTPLPERVALPWVIGDPLPLLEFSLGIKCGAARPGDTSAWVWELSQHTHDHLRFDLDVGGHEHNLERREVLDAVVMLSQHASCKGTFIQHECGPWSVARFLTGSQESSKLPAPIFTADFPDGVQVNGAVVVPAQRALFMLADMIRIARGPLDRGGWVIWEQPACQGHGPYASADMKQHSDAYSTTMFRAFFEKYELSFIYTDQGLSGAATRKATQLCCSPCRAHALRRELGVLRMSAPMPNAPRTTGRDDSGTFNTRRTQVYSPIFCERIARCIVLAAAPTVAGGEATHAQTDGNSNAVTEVASNEDATETHPHADKLNSRIEVYWTGERCWYAGRLVDTRFHTHKIKGKKVRAPESCVAYDDGATYWHALHNNTMRFNQSSSVLQNLAVTDALADPCPVGTLVQLLSGETGKVIHTRITTCDEGHQHEMQVQIDDKKTEWMCAHTGKVLSPSDEPCVMSLLGERTEHCRWLHEEVLADRTNWTGDDPQLYRLWCTNEIIDDRMILVHDVMLSIEDEVVESTWTMLHLDENRKLLSVTTKSDLDTSLARHWHTPSNEREFNRSPQRGLWLTAKELKWSQYLELRMFSWVAVSQIDTRKYRIYNTLWAYKIKLNSDSTFKSLNPRWCLKGGTMDRDIYKSYAETLRMSSYKTILAICAGYYDMFAKILIDCANAFQSTRTDTVAPQSGNAEQPKVYCWPAPGFEKRTPSGERMACEVHVGMQGRIDATRLFNQRLMSILAKAKCQQLSWDRQLVIYHHGPLERSDASLSDVLKAIKGAEDSSPQQQPVGWAVLGWHVDDGMGLACDVHWCLDHKKNRVVQFLLGVISQTYATTLTGWHGNKALGFTLTLNDVKKTVSMSAPDMLAQMATLAFDDSTPRYTPKHITTDGREHIPPGEVPAIGDPARDTVLSRNQLTRKLLGAGIWLSNAHAQMVEPWNKLCKNMHCPHELTLKEARHTVAALVASPRCNTYGGWNTVGLEAPAHRVQPFTVGRKDMAYHVFSDASNSTISVTGGVGMLAGGPIQSISQNQHLSAPESHTAEVVAAGNVLSAAVGVNGVLQELRIRLGVATPFYLDSRTTILVACDDSAARKSVWLKRRIAVLQDGVNLGEIVPLHIGERDMVADPLTKYLPYSVWIRHMAYLLNDCAHWE